MTESGLYYRLGLGLAVMTETGLYYRLDLGLAVYNRDWTVLQVRFLSLADYDRGDVTPMNLGDR
jgi:hypothetical protein